MRLPANLPNLVFLIGKVKVAMKQRKKKCHLNIDRLQLWKEYHGIAL